MLRFITTVSLIISWLPQHREEKAYALLNGRSYLEKNVMPLALGPQVVSSKVRVIFTLVHSWNNLQLVRGNQTDLAVLREFLEMAYFVIADAD